MGLFKSKKDHKLAVKWIAGFEMFETTPLLVAAELVETDNNFLLVADDSENFREFKRLTDGKILFRKGRESEMSLLSDSPDEAMDAFVHRQEHEVKKAEIRLKVAKGCLIAADSREPRRVLCTH